VFLLLVFEFVRTREIDVYAPRTRGCNAPAPKPQNGWFSWIRQVYWLDEDQVLEMVGLDGHVMLRFLLFCTKLCSYCSIGSCALMPIYFYAKGDDSVTSIAKLSMANIDQRGDRLWVSFGFMYWYTCVFLFLMHKEYRHFTTARNKFFLGKDKNIPTQMNYSIQVENIPPEFQTSHKLHDFFEAIFPGQVLCATVEVALPNLDAAVSSRNEVVVKLENAIAEFEASECKRRPTLILPNGMLFSFIVWVYSGKNGEGLFFFFSLCRC
jgi:hypothetical protein